MSPEPVPAARATQPADTRTPGQIEDEKKMAAELAAKKKKAQEIEPVEVRNKGTQAWFGSDFASVGNGHIPAGGTGIVTRKKFEQLQADYKAGNEQAGGVGPFEEVKAVEVKEVK